MLDAQTTEWASERTQTHLGGLQCRCALLPTGPRSVLSLQISNAAFCPALLPSFWVLPVGKEKVYMVSCRLGHAGLGKGGMGAKNSCGSNETEILGVGKARRPTENALNEFLQKENVARNMEDDAGGLFPYYAREVVLTAACWSFVLDGASCTGGDEIGTLFFLPRPAE